MIASIPAERTQLYRLMLIEEAHERAIDRRTQKQETKTVTTTQTEEPPTQSITPNDVAFMLMLTIAARWKRIAKARMKVLKHADNTMDELEELLIERDAEIKQRDAEIKHLDKVIDSRDTQIEAQRRYIQRFEATQKGKPA